MDKTFWTVLAKRCLKGLLAASLAFLGQFAIEQIPAIVNALPSVIHSPVFVSVVTGLLLAAEKGLISYRPQ